MGLVEGGRLRFSLPSAPPPTAAVVLHLRNSLLCVDVLHGNLALVVLRPAVGAPRGEALLGGLLHDMVVAPEAGLVCKQNRGGAAGGEPGGRRENRANRAAGARAGGVAALLTATPAVLYAAVGEVQLIAANWAVWVPL